MSQPQSNTIYVALQDEGTVCWRPVEAIRLSNDVCRIVSLRSEDEQWQFETGDVVRCRENSSVDNESFLEAFELAPLDLDEITENA